MTTRNQDLHGSAPDKADVALLLIDVINDLEFEGAEKLFPHALSMARRLAEFKRRAKKNDVPVIYANDNFGRWRSNFQLLLKHCLEDEVRGEQIVRLLAPDEDDYFVLKPKHSGFFSTTLDTMLRYLGTKTLIITGLATDICVLFTANDAYMRDFKLIVPSDCVAAEDPTESERALNHMRRVLKTDVRPSTEIDFSAEFPNAGKVEMKD
jgi:nicotinamidase-related amidase